MNDNFKRLDEKELEQVAGGADGLFGKLYYSVWREGNYICWSFVGGENDYPESEEYWYNGNCTGTSRLSRYGTLRQCYQGPGTYSIVLVFADGHTKQYDYYAAE